MRSDFNSDIYDLFFFFFFVENHDIYDLTLIICDVFVEAFLLWWYSLILKFYLCNQMAPSDLNQYT